MGKTVFQLSPDGGTTKYDLRDSNIAPIELDSAHASQPYAVKEEFVLDADGLLYEATSPISQNDAFIVYPTSGYNCKLSDSVTGQIRAIKDSLGTASTKNAISVVTDSTDLVESGAVKTAIDTAISSAYKPAGPKTCAELVPALLVEANNGNVYNITDSGTTTADFIEGAGHPIREGDNVGVCEPTAGTYKFDLLSGFIDTSGFQTKTITGTIESQTTVEGALSALSTNKQPKTMSAPITVDGTQETTVEGALSAINTLAADNKTAINGIKDGQNIDSFADVENALAGKQDILGLYVDDDGYICQD